MWKDANYAKSMKKMQNFVSPKLQYVPVPSEFMKHIGVDICNLQEVNGCKQLVILEVVRS